jgi:predicted dehydrogenase
MTKSQKIPVGVMGCGTVAQYGHLPAIASTPGLQLAAIADVQAREDVAAQYVVPQYNDYRELLRNDEIQAVTICTRVESHYEIARAALQAGKHVFCEKPLADSPQRCRVLASLAQRHNRLLAVNFEYRLSPAIGAMRKYLQNSEIGALQVMRFIYNWSAHGIHGVAGARRAAFLQHGGGAMDCGIHWLDLARFLSDSEPASFTARGQWVEEEFSYPGHVLLQARMQSGALAHIEAGFVYTHASRDRTFDLRLEVIGQRGVVSWLALPPRPGDKTADGSQGELQIFTPRRTEIHPAPLHKDFAGVYAEWTRCLRRGTLQGSVLASGEDGLRATSWMWRALDQARKERRKFSA